MWISSNDEKLIKLAPIQRFEISSTPYQTWNKSNQFNEIPKQIKLNFTS